MTVWFQQIFMPQSNQDAKAKRAILLLKRTTEQLTQNDDLRKVLAEYTSSASADADNEEMLRVHGCFLASVGQRSLAADNFEKCLKLQPNSEHCIISYACLLLAGINQEARLSELERASELLKRITKLNPNHPKALKLLQRISARFSESDFALLRTENGYINVQACRTSSFSPRAHPSTFRSMENAKSPVKDQEVASSACVLLQQLTTSLQDKSEMLADLTKCLNRYNNDVANITQLEQQNVFSKEEAHQQRQEALERFEKAKQLIMSGKKLSTFDDDNEKAVKGAPDDSDDDMDVSQLRRNTKKKFFFCVPIPSL
ncbi:hypothetical protein GUITHDRAFT_100182 [Guillardia theta CCMP2712]|uniref:Uncharacterized protein n=1 Tax=Guillardia theta (strain CCMP2712) TaxID=905079 RepID=L1JZZ4_GUITC|nr:hypothetical protein GUITHDRAFT_100182 [Guillardia theta CCMP2712]EKX53932.1 hypothetical protein GUITHDRAFT_100182 [Guillardia theta CCMP2712]|eukprot:XP_005840912.1 hypothetical protein GUITHDRAFT_100182 [Guillardia theta CCMP2712]